MFPFATAMLAAGELTISTAFTQTLTTDSPGWHTYTARCSTSSDLSAGGTQVRVTFEAPASGTMVCDHAAIGIKGTDQQTNAAPVELLFSGASGFTISNGATIVSDWVTLTTTTSDKVVVIADINSTNGNGTLRSTATILTDTTSFKVGASYNSANPAGMTTGVDYSLFFNKIEVR